MARVPLNRYFAFFAIAALGCGLDLWTKHFMFAWPQLEQGASYWLVEGHAGFQRSLNEGALFGLGQGKQFWFAGLSILAAIAIPVWLFVYRAAHDWLMTVTLGAITAGILGNLYDRLGLPGLVWGQDVPLLGDHKLGEPVYAVRDWILLQWDNQWRWPNFNIADSFLVVGAATIFFYAMLQPEEKKSAAEEPKK